VPAAGDQRYALVEMQEVKPIRIVRVAVIVWGIGLILLSGFELAVPGSVRSDYAPKPYTEVLISMLLPGVGAALMIASPRWLVANKVGIPAIVGLVLIVGILAAQQGGSRGKESILVIFGIPAAIAGRLIQRELRRGSVGRS